MNGRDACRDVWTTLHMSLPYISEYLIKYFGRDICNVETYVGISKSTRTTNGRGLKRLRGHLLLKMTHCNRPRPRNSHMNVISQSHQQKKTNKSQAAPGLFPRRSVAYFALMLIEAFSYVQFVPLTPKYIIHFFAGIRHFSTCNYPRVYKLFRPLDMHTLSNRCCHTPLFLMFFYT